MSYLNTASPADETTLELLAREAELDAMQAELADDADYLAWHDAKEAAADLRALRLAGLLEALPLTSADALRQLRQLGGDSVVSITGVHPDDLATFVAAVDAELARRSAVVHAA